MHQVLPCSRWREGKIHDHVTNCQMERCRERCVPVGVQARQECTVPSHLCTGGGGSTQRIYLSADRKRERGAPPTTNVGGELTNVGGELTNVGGELANVGGELTNVGGELGLLGGN